MRNIEIRPNMRTAGGEANDILLNGRFMGTLMLVYREGDRVTGSIQLEEASLKPADKPHVVQSVQRYIQSFIHAVKAEACDVFVTYSDYDHVVMTSDHDAAYADEEELTDDDELVLIAESASSAHYLLYEHDGREVAEALLRFESADISGDVEWRIEPDEDEIEWATTLIVSDFEEDTVDTFVLRHLYQDMLLETIELTHEALLEDAYDEDQDLDYYGRPSDRYSVSLARDDGDVLTYEIYEHASGALPIGTATIDMQEPRLTGFIDFRERGKTDEAGAIAEVLMRELDKEKDGYEGLNLTLMYKNKFLDEFVIENETIH